MMDGWPTVEEHETGDPLLRLPWGYVPYVMLGFDGVARQPALPGASANRGRRRGKVALLELVAMEWGLGQRQVVPHNTVSLPICGCDPALTPRCGERVLAQDRVPVAHAVLRSSAPARRCIRPPRAWHAGAQLLGPRDWRWLVSLLGDAGCLRR